MSFYPTAPAPTPFRAFRPVSLLSGVGPTTRESSALGSIALSPRPLQETSEPLTFQEVIVPLDGSPHAEHALPWAIQLASLAGARIRLLHVHQQMQPAFRVRRLDLYRQFDRLLREPMEEYLAGVVRRLARAASVGVASTLVDAREVNAALSELVASTNDIMVMATRGRTVFGRALAGNRLDAILQRRQAPILCVRGYSCPVDLTARPSLRHALVPLDGSSKSADILRPLTTLSKLTGGRQTLLRVVQSAGAAACGHGSSGPKAGDGKDSPLSCLEKLATVWRHELPLVRTSVVWSDDSPARAMLAEAEAKEVDFIAIATRPRSRLSRLLRPGIFDRLIRRAKVPILVVKQTDQGIGSATDVEPACDAGTC